MTQTAQVRRLLPGGKAEIAVVRQGACAHDCSECGGCMTAQQPTVTAVADDLVGIQEGDIVTVETENAKLMGLIAFVYLVPMVLLVAGYLAAQAAGMAQGWCILAGAGAFPVCIFLVVLLERHIKKSMSIRFQIVAKVL